MNKSLLSALLLVAASCVPSAQASLLLHYQMDEGTGKAVADTGTGTAANGTFVGTGSGWTTDTPSGAGFAYSVNDDAGSSYITGGTIGKVQGLGDFTISFWTKLSDISANTDRIFSTRGAGGTGNGFLDIIAASTDETNMTLRLEFGDGVGASGIASSSVFNATEWVFVAVVRDAATGTVQFYIGDTDPTAPLGLAGTTAGQTKSTSINQNSGEFRLGGTASTSSNRTPDGYFSDFRIYDEMLSGVDLNAIRVDAIPEPATTALLGVAALGLVFLRKRFKKQY